MSKQYLFLKCTLQKFHPFSNEFELGAFTRSRAVLTSSWVTWGTKRLTMGLTEWTLVTLIAGEGVFM